MVWVVVAAMALAAPAPEVRGETYVLVPAAGSQVKLEGTSNLHDWEATGIVITGEIEIPADFLLDPQQAAMKHLQGGGGPPPVEVEIPVESIASDKRRLNRLMYAALLAEEHPLIRYRLLQAAVLEDEFDHPDRFRLATAGELRVAGVERPLEMEVLVERGADSQVVVSGTVDLKMSEFGINPPRALLGTLRTADELTVSFRWVLAPR